MPEAVFVGYYRVSTGKQGLSGLGLEAQKNAVYAFLKASQDGLAAEFTEIESGRRKDRPRLAAALELCRKRRATLVIAKLDRLARNVAFVSALLESGVRFVAVDMPEADISFLQLMAVFAEWEARKIGERTKAALAAKKARGHLLGWANPERADEQRRAAQVGAKANADGADQFAQNVTPLIQGIERAGIVTLSGIAQALNERGVRTARGRRWHPTTVRNILARPVCAA